MATQKTVPQLIEQSKPREIIGCCLYARVSTKDKGQEVENQLRQLREFSSSQGWAVYREFVDHETGSTNDRTAFQTMFKDASQRKFDVLLFWALDRLSREGVLETLQHLNRLTSYGVGYRSFTEQYFDSCGIFKDAVIAIIATVAKQERVRISLRVRAGLEVARAKGKRIGRPPRTLLSAETRTAIADSYMGGGTSLRLLTCRVAFTGDSAESNPRLWSDDGQSGSNRITSCLPTIRPECAGRERHFHVNPL